MGTPSNPDVLTEAGCSKNHSMYDARPIGGNLTGLKQYRDREPQDCRVSDAEAIATAPRKPKNKRVTVYVLGKWHREAQTMTEILYEYHCAIGKQLAKKQKELSKNRNRYNHGNAKTFDKWLEENKAILGFSKATAYRYIKTFEESGEEIKEPEPIQGMGSTAKISVDLNENILNSEPVVIDPEKHTRERRGKSSHTKAIRLGENQVSRILEHVSQEQYAETVRELVDIGLDVKGW